ncbi:hypothetical protein Hypma_006262 [Hypsizygus marmoreus]|uniref:Uncharacterized protein n=1 Tax=Hypsizygus marmoreus TaxID=39966 RepID=A0A369JXB3_HYPMA|nr:hypothetical protein Hypma_006262 [Hypsizygus marmoreus]
MSAVLLGVSNLGILEVLSALAVLWNIKNKRIRIEGGFGRISTKRRRTTQLNRRTASTKDCPAYPPCTQTGEPPQVGKDSQICCAASFLNEVGYFYPPIVTPVFRSYFDSSYVVSCTIAIQPSCLSADGLLVRLQGSHKTASIRAGELTKFISYTSDSSRCEWPILTVPVSSISLHPDTLSRIAIMLINRDSCPVDSTGNKATHG